MALFDTLLIKYRVAKLRHTRNVAQKKFEKSNPIDKDLSRDIKRFTKSGQVITLDELASEMAEGFNDKVKDYSVKAHRRYGLDDKKKANAHYMLIDVKINLYNHHIKFCSEQYIRDDVLVEDPESSGHLVSPQALTSLPIEPNYHLLAQKGHVGKAYLSLMTRKNESISQR